MFIVAGRSLSVFHNEVWQFRVENSTWAQFSALAPPPARAYHTAILDPQDRALLVFGGESSQALNDLHRLSLVDGQWSESGALGPGARSRHTAVWDAVSRSMLIYAGWSGQQYLHGLHSYDASADCWTDVPAAGDWPAARGGHASAWDPVSRSMLVMGGIRNVSGSQSYDPTLWNYSLLTGSWREEGLQAAVPGPSGRMGHAIIWDEHSRGLLSFGGFNSSYLKQTWRFVVSQTDMPLVVSCQLGFDCLLHVGNISGSVAVKRLCSDMEVLEGLQPLHSEEIAHDRWMLGRPAWPLFVEPGHHRLCWCEANCSQPLDFLNAIGYLVVVGPYLNQSAQCELGSFCKIPEWRGTGIGENDSVIIQSKCMTQEAAPSYHQHRAVTISFNKTYGWHTLHVGFLDPAEGLKPETLELCWCPADKPCASAEDFTVVALLLHIICPPGQYRGPDSSCLRCPEDRFCPGGTEMQNCPFASTSSAGSRQLPSCRAVST